MLSSYSWRGPRLRRYIGRPCPYCARQMNHAKGAHGPLAPSRDHRVPTCRGGMTILVNLIVCCRSCNELKGALDVAEFLAWREGLASRLDHGWWSRLPGVRRYPYAHHARLRLVGDWGIPAG